MNLVDTVTRLFRRAQGFRNWSYQYQKANPMDAYVKNYIQQYAPGLMSQGGSAPSGPAPSSSSSSGGGQPSLSSFWSQ